MLPLPASGAGAVTNSLPPFAHGEPYVDYFVRLGSAEAPGAALRRLLSHVDALLDADERVALWLAQWQAAQRLPTAERERIAACLDGRHAGDVARLALPWDSPLLVAHLAASALKQPSAQPGAVLALLAHHGWHPVDEPGRHPPALVLLAALAEISATTRRLEGAMIHRLQNALVDASGRDPSLSAPALGCLFDLALHARDDDTATAVLAELVAQGRCAVLIPKRVCDWLDGSSAIDDPGERQPLVLAERWQREWLQPGAWQRPETLATLLTHLKRDAPRERLLRLALLLGHDLSTTRAAEGRSAWKALQVLDTAWDRCARGEDPLPLLQPMIERNDLANDTLAALHTSAAALHTSAGAFEAAAITLARARRARADDTLLRNALATVLRQLGSEAITTTPAFSRDWRDEEPFWKQLLQRAPEALQRVAGFHLARLWSDGCLEPGAPVRQLQARGAIELWRWLAPHPVFAGDARRALQDRTLAAVMQSGHDGPGGEHLWIETAGATRLLVVFSCAVSHHTYPEVAALRGRLPDHHLLFVRNAEFNWYSDAAFDALADLVREKVLPRFAPGQVSCYYGSMGGHGALKLALEFGFRALVFNPQVDLDLWATRRPQQRPQLWAARRHASLDEWPPDAFERMPLYCACGSDSADREALSALIARLRECRQLNLVIEKYADPHHAGLMNRISVKAIPDTLARIEHRLGELLQDESLADLQWLPEGTAAASRFWDSLDEACAMKVEIQVRDGRLGWRPAARSGTR